MNPDPRFQELIRRGVASLGDVPNAADRAALLVTAAEQLADEDLAMSCRATASCLREAEAAQLRLFQSIRR